MDASLSAFVESTLFSIGSHGLTVGVALLASGVIWREMQRFGGSFLSYIFSSFLVIAFHSLMIIVTTAWYGMSGARLPVAYLPMITHLCKLTAMILAVYGCIVAASTGRFFRQFFLITNLSFLALYSSIVWICWLHYLDTAPGGQGVFDYFWGHLIYESWLVIILWTGLYFCRREWGMGNAFLLGFSLLLVREMLHIWNMLAPSVNLPWISVGDRLLLILYIGLIGIAVDGIGERVPPLQPDTPLRPDPHSRAVDIGTHETDTAHEDCPCRDRDRFPPEHGMDHLQRG